MLVMEINFVRFIDVSQVTTHRNAHVKVKQAASRSTKRKNNELNGFVMVYAKADPLFVDLANKRTSEYLKNNFDVFASRQKSKKTLGILR